MRDIFAVVAMTILVGCAVNPESVGAWLREVDDARYITTDYK